MAGLGAAVVVVGVFEGAGHFLYPPPPGLDLTNPADQARMMESLPMAAKLAVVLAWFAGSLAGSWAALRVSGEALSAWLVAGAMVAMSLITTAMFPHPGWMIGAAILLPLLAAWLVIRRRKAEQP